MNQFKTLAEARSAYDALAVELADTQQKLTKMAGLESELAESKAFGSTAATENENFRLLIVQKDEEISTLKADKYALNVTVAEFKDKVDTLEKNQKTAKIHARELVAASGGIPIAIDQAEINRMQAGDQKDFRERMLKEQDPVLLNQLYKEYNQLFRPNGQPKKK